MWRRSIIVDRRLPPSGGLNWEISWILPGRSLRSRLPGLFPPDGAGGPAVMELATLQLGPFLAHATRALDAYQLSALAVLLFNIDQTFTALRASDERLN